MRSLAYRISSKDPSRLKATENARAKIAESDLQDTLNLIVKRVVDSNATSPNQIQLIVRDELARYQNLSTEKNISWITDTIGRSVIRSEQLMKAVGVDVRAQFGPKGISTELKEMLTINVRNDIESLTVDLKKKVTASLIDGMKNGLGPKVIAKQISDDTGLPRARAVTIARTETMKAHVTTAVDTFKKFGVEKVEWLVADDDRLCDKCMELNGKQYPIDDHPDCPLHPNCRCVLIPVVEEMT